MTGRVFGKEVRCAAKCNGQVAVEGTMTKQLPLGFGFVGAKFQIDVARWSGYYGFCLKCGNKVFAPFGRAKRVTKVAKNNSANEMRRAFRAVTGGL
jgi:hypothetical protein